MLAGGLAHLATEGDSGEGTLQEVAATLAQALREHPAAGANGQPAEPYVELAQLVRYERVQASLGDPQFAAAMAKLEADDKARQSAGLPAGQAPELAAGRWEQARVTMPASWCAPCKAELPEIERLYRKVKDRPDFQILTFDMDEELGLVAPFMQEKGFTFPVLPAYGFVTSLTGSAAVPQNWIVDPKGAWRWSQIGYDSSDAKWAESMIGKLELVKVPATASGAAIR